MTSIDTDRAPKAIGPYSQAVMVGGWLWISGQIPLDPATGELVEGDIEAQTERVLKNIEAILAAVGLDWSRVVKTTCFLQDLGDFARFNGVYERFFSTHRPARSTVQVCALPRGARVEIEAVACLA